MAKTLHLIGVKKAWVVHGLIGLDEISPVGESLVWELDPDGNILEKRISPSDFGLSEHPLTLVKGGNAIENADIMTKLLKGDLQGPILDFVLLNSAALLFVSGKVKTLKEGVALARESIQSGSALTCLKRFVQFYS